MNKREKKELRKDFRRLRLVFKILFVTIILAVLLWLLQLGLEHWNNHLIIVERVTEQDTQITHLQEQLNEVTQSNAQLQETVQHQQSTITELVNNRLVQQSPPQVNLGGEPLVERPVVVQESNPFEVPSPSLVPIMVVGVMQVMKSILIPAF